MKPFRFLLLITVLGIVIFLLALLGVRMDWFARPSLLQEILLINIAVTFLIYRFLFRIDNPQLFVNAYLISIVAKLIFYAGLLLALRISMPQSLTANAVLVLVCYIAFTTAEVTILFLKVGR